MKKRTIVISLIAATVFAVGTAGTAIALDSKSQTDSGVTACQMMSEDRVADSKPSDQRAADELELLLGSENQSLQRAGLLLQKGDVKDAFEVFDLLVSGCVEIDSPI